MNHITKQLYSIIRCTTPLEATPPSRLPGLCPRPHTLSSPSPLHTHPSPLFGRPKHNQHPLGRCAFPSPLSHTHMLTYLILPLLHTALSIPSSRIPSPMRRHMLTSPSPSNLITTMEKEAHTPTMLHRQYVSLLPSHPPTTFSFFSFPSSPYSSLLLLPPPPPLPTPPFSFFLLLLLLFPFSLIPSLLPSLPPPPFAISIPIQVLC